MKTEEAIKNNKGEIKSLTYLMKYLLPYKKHLIVMFIALLVTSGAVLGIGKSLQYVIDYGLSTHNQAMLDKALIYMILVVIVLAVATAIRFYMVTYVGESAIAKLRVDIFNKILSLSSSFYESNKSGEILSRLTTDTTLLLVVLSSSISFALRNCFMLIGGIVLLIATSHQLFGVMIMVLPIVIIPIKLLGKSMRKYSKISQDKVAEISAIAEESINGIKTIQAYSREDFEQNKFNVKSTELINFAIKRIRIRAILISAIIMIVFGSIGVILWTGGHKVLSGELSAGALSSFIFISIVCAGALGALVEVYSELQRAGGATERIVAFLNMQSDILNIGEKEIDPSNAKIVFKDVSFSYPSRPNNLSLKNLSFEIEVGKVTAIVGESGSGKSTIFQLLLRFYDITTGNILIGDNDIKDYKLKNLRSFFGYVTQDPLIFSTSVFDNILYGKLESTKTDLVQAAKMAAADEFINELPEKYATYLGEKGVKISGGQKQRISIARAFLSDPHVILLDEATSSLDSRNEQLVQNALNSIIKNRTAIIIAHRLSTVQNADKIIVLRAGRIVETGNHNSLMEAKGEYYRLATIKDE